MNQITNALGIPKESQKTALGIIHADRHGSIVIPNDVIPKLKSAIETVIESEAIVLGPAREPGFDIDRLEEVWAKFEATRT